MSDPTVRSAVRALAATLDPPFPFFETVNVRPDPRSLPDPGTTGVTYFTVRFDVFDRTRRAVGNKCWREDGAFSLVVMVTQGQGDSLATGFWQIAEPAIRGYSWPAGMHLSSITPPEAFDGDDRLTPGWQRWDVVVRYLYDTEV